jgi:hypothetical protein
MLVTLPLVSTFKDFPLPKKKKKTPTSIQYSLLARAVKRHKRSLPPLIMRRNFLKNRTFLGVGKDGRFVCLSKTHLYGQISWQCD